MANPPVDCFVDPSIAGDSGTGTLIDPYGDIQYALNTETRNSSIGNRFNIKAGTAEVLTAPLSLSTFGAPSYQNILIFQGYEAVQGDGGLGIINCSGNQSLTLTGSGINWYSMELYNGPATGTIIAVAGYSSVINCYIHDSDGSGVDTGSSSGNYSIVGNRFEDLGGSAYAMLITDYTFGHITNNYFNWGGTRECLAAIYSTANGMSITGNIISLGTNSHGIYWTGSNYATNCSANTILGVASVKDGIQLDGTFAQIARCVINNYVEGFNGTGGYGISMTGSAAGGGVFGQNAFYNAPILNNSETMLELGDNEILTVSGIAKAGADTFANRFAYFAPVDTGNMQTGGYPEA